MKSIDKIRILVGLNVDKFTVRIIDRASEKIGYTTVSTTEGKEQVEQDITREFENSSATAEIEKGVRKFIDWLRSGKLEMRMYTEAPIHAKAYIMRKDPEKVPDTYGSVITGSSNFSEAGLLNNLEFNVELKDAADVEFALDRFEELWAKSMDIRETYIDTVENKTWMRDDITPYELYLKTLYEFFKEEINADKESFDTLLPDGYMRLQYQIDAVTQARQRLDAYNGFFISDVVGLGKTYICAMLANSFNRNTYKLIVCPPVLVDYWRSVLQEFDVARCDVESLGKLDHIIAKGTDKYTYVVSLIINRFRASIQRTIFFCICSHMEIAVTIWHTNKRPPFKQIVLCGVSDPPFPYSGSHNIQSCVQARIIKSSFNIHRPRSSIIVYAKTTAIEI